VHKTSSLFRGGASAAAIGQTAWKGRALASTKAKSELKKSKVHARKNDDRPARKA
jgi:hypothetical protein